MVVVVMRGYGGGDSGEDAGDERCGGDSNDD